MFKPILIFSILPLIATNALAIDIDKRKIQAVKSLHEDALKTVTYDEWEHFVGADDLDVLFMHADEELQNAIALTKLDPKGAYTGDKFGFITECNEVLDELMLTGGLDYRLDEATSFNYAILNNGNVRVFHLFEDNDNNPTFRKDFKLKCGATECIISDVVGQSPNYKFSAVKDANKFCR